MYMIGQERQTRVYESRTVVHPAGHLFRASLHAERRRVPRRLLASVLIYLYSYVYMYIYTSMYVCIVYLVLFHSHDRYHFMCLCRLPVLTRLANARII